MSEYVNALGWSKMERTTLTWTIAGRLYRADMTFQSRGPDFMLAGVRKVLALALLAGCAAVDPDRNREEIRNILAAQAEAWNRGDLDAFLTGYWRSHRTVFARGA